MGTQEDFLFIYFIFSGVGMCLTGTAEESAGRGQRVIPAKAMKMLQMST